MKASKIEWYVTVGNNVVKQRKTRALARKFKNGLKKRGLDARIQRVEYSLADVSVIR